MTTIFVSHRSAFVTYLVAAALKLHYRHRTLRIVIVEFFDKSTPTDNRLYCGVSTVSNFPLDKWPFHTVLLAQVLALVLTFVDSVHVHASGAERLTPELPIWAQSRTVVARVGDARRFLALFYQPQRVEQALATFLAESPNVTFMSVQSQQSLPSVIENLSRRTGKGHADVWLDLDSSSKTIRMDNGAVNLDILANSTMCGLQLINGRNRAIGHYFSQANRSFLSPNVLWLPLFKAGANIVEPKFHQQIQNLRHIVSLSVTPVNLNVQQETFASRHDLLYGLKMSHYVLEAVDNMLKQYNLNLVPHRL